MLGNVWEWVQDCWHESYDGAPGDGSAWHGADCVRHVARGGSWRSGPDALRTAIRNAFPPDHRRSTLGFRVVREVAEKSAPPCLRDAEALEFWVAIVDSGASNRIPDLFHTRVVAIRIQIRIFDRELVLWHWSSETCKRLAPSARQARDIRA